MLSVGGMREFFNKFGNGCTLAVLGAFALSLVIGYSGNQGGRGGRNGGNSANPAEALVATVNGQPITEGDFREMNAQVQQRSGSAPAGTAFAGVQGQTMQNLVQRAVITQEAQRRNARPLEADLDKAIDQYRQSVAQQTGKTKLTDSEWADYLQSSRGMSVSDLREQAAKSLIPVALINTLKSEEKVTEVEARNQSAKAHLALISVPYQEAGVPVVPGKTKPLSEAEAQQKAAALYAKVKGGADFATIARSNTDNPDEAKKGGDVEPLDEYSAANAPGQMSLNLALGYGKDLADAVHKLAPGQNTDVVKISGLFQQHAVGFARLIDRKLATPKDFDSKKAIAALTEQRAAQKAETLIKSLVKSAKIEFKDLDKKAYYDYAQLQSAESESYQAMMSGQAATPPTKAETDAQQAVIDKDFDDMLKRHPDDVTAAILVADRIKAQKLLDAASQDRLIALDETIAKSSDDFDRHFDLADIYGKRKQYDKAKIHLDRVAKLLGYNTPYDLDGLKSANALHERLEKAYRAISQPAEADKEKALSDALQPKIMAANIKQLEEQRRAKAAQTAPGIQAVPQVSVPAGGGSQSITITPTPTPADKPAPAMKDGGTAAPPANAPTTPPSAPDTAPTPAGSASPPHVGKGR